MTKKNATSNGSATQSPATISNTGKSPFRPTSAKQKTPQENKKEGNVSTLITPQPSTTTKKKDNKKTVTSISKEGTIDLDRTDCVGTITDPIKIREIILAEAQNKKSSLANVVSELMQPYFKDEGIGYYDLCVAPHEIIRYLFPLKINPAHPRESLHIEENKIPLEELVFNNDDYFTVHFIKWLDRPEDVVEAHENHNWMDNSRSEGWVHRRSFIQDYLEARATCVEIRRLQRRLNSAEMTANEISRGQTLSFNWEKFQANRNEIIKIHTRVQMCLLLCEYVKHCRNENLDPKTHHKDIEKKEGQAGVKAFFGMLLRKVPRKKVMEMVRDVNAKAKDCYKELEKAELEKAKLENRKGGRKKRGRKAAGAANAEHEYSKKMKRLFREQLVIALNKIRTETNTIGYNPNDKTVCGGYGKLKMIVVDSEKKKRAKRTKASGGEEAINQQDAESTTAVNIGGTADVGYDEAAVTRGQVKQTDIQLKGLLLKLRTIDQKTTEGTNDFRQFTGQLSSILFDIHQVCASHLGRYNYYDICDTSIADDCLCPKKEAPIIVPRNAYLFTRTVLFTVSQFLSPSKESWYLNPEELRIWADKAETRQFFALDTMVVTRTALGTFFGGDGARSQLLEKEKIGKVLDGFLSLFPVQVIPPALHPTIKSALFVIRRHFQADTSRSFPEKWIDIEKLANEVSFIDSALKLPVGTYLANASGLATSIVCSKEVLLFFRAIDLHSDLIVDDNCDVFTCTKIFGGIATHYYSGFHRVIGSLTNMLHWLHDDLFTDVLAGVAGLADNSDLPRKLANLPSFQVPTLQPTVVLILKTALETAGWPAAQPSADAANALIEKMMGYFVSSKLESWETNKINGVQDNDEHDEGDEEDDE